jgi:DNA-binding NtrC family response regulator
VFYLRTPALRERREDIFELAVYFLNLHAGRTGKLVTHLDPEAVEALVAYDWPGNIRELENTIERAVVLADGPSVTLEDLPIELRQPGRRRLRPRISAGVGSAASVAVARAPAKTLGISGGAAASAWSAAGEPSPGEDWNAEFIAYERQRLIDALKEAGGNKSVAARLLGMPRSTFFSKVKKHGVL